MALQDRLFCVLFSLLPLPWGPLKVEGIQRKLRKKDESLFTKKTLLTISVQNPGNTREHTKPVFTERKRLSNSKRLGKGALLS